MKGQIFHMTAKYQMIKPSIKHYEPRENKTRLQNQEDQEILCQVEGRPALAFYSVTTQKFLTRASKLLNYFLFFLYLLQL